MAKRKITSTKSSPLQEDLSKLLLRLAFGGLMLIAHGWPKLMKFVSDDEIKFRDPLGIGTVNSLAMATFAELICALLIIFGLFTRLAAVPLIITMLVIIFMVHLNDPLSKLELPILYLVAFVVIGLIGPGKWSLDHLLKK
jgi:putative oxidoreductase